MLEQEINFSRCPINNVIKKSTEKGEKGKERPKKLKNQSKPTVKRLLNSSIKRLITKVKKRISTANPPSQRKLSRDFGISHGMVNRIIDDDLGAQRRKKTRPHALSHVEVTKFLGLSRLLHLKKKKLNYILSPDEAWIMVNNITGQRDNFF